jgi:hypothetical protein
VSGQLATAPDINLSDGADTNLSLNTEAELDVFGGVGVVRAAVQQAAGLERVCVVEVVLAPAGVARLGTECVGGEQGGGFAGGESVAEVRTHERPRRRGRVGGPAGPPGPFVEREDQLVRGSWSLLRLPALARPRLIM